MSERILVVGLEAEGERIHSVGFDGEATLDGHSCVAVDPAAACALWVGLASARDAAGRAEAAERLVGLVQRRRREATALVNRGGSLLCFLRPVGPTARLTRPGPQGTRSIVLHAYAWLPEEPSLARLVIAPAQGREIRAADDSHPAWRLIQAQGDRLRPAACAANTQPPKHWHPIATDESGRLLAFEVGMGKGRIVFAPPLAADDPAVRGALIEQFFAAPAAVREAAPQPDWLAALQLPGQPELASRLAALAQQIEGLEREFIDVRKRHSRLVDINRLLSARAAGDLAGPAAAAFRLLGFHVEAADAAALLLSCDEGSALAVLTAAEEAVSSDAYWDLVHRMDDGPREVAKGIILANAFHSLAPDQRGIVFPDLLRRGALHREVCLIESAELHRACAALLGKAEDGALLRKLRTAILETTGPCFLSQLLAPSAEGQQGANVQ